VASVIVVNGTRVEVPDGRSVRVDGGTVTVGDTQVVTGLSGVVRVEWSGPAADVHSDAAVTVHGSVSGRVSANGSVSCGDVGGGVDARGSVTCGAVGGSVRAGGSVKHG
jgi:hypothetical protein